MMMAGVFAPNRAVSIISRGFKIPPSANVRKQASWTRISYKKDANDRIEDAADNIKRATNDAKDDLKGWRRVGEEKVDEFGNKLADAAEEASNDIRGRSPNGGAAHLYGIAGLAILALEAFKIWRPDTATYKVFGFVMTKLGSEVSVLTGHLATVPFLMQCLGVLSIPAICACLNQAQQAKAGNLACDSSMRFSFGLGVSALVSAVAIGSSPLYTNMGGPAIIWACATTALTLAAVFKSVSSTHDFQSLVQNTTKGVVQTLMRALKPKTLEGALYGICFVLTTAAVGLTLFNPWIIGDMFGTGLANLVPVHRDVITLMSRAISAQLAFVAVSFAALKELADKKALASSTARLMNVGMSAMLVGLGVLLRAGERNGMYNATGAKLVSVVTGVSAAMLLACAVFMIYPASKSEVTEDTPLVCY